MSSTSFRSTVFDEITHKEYHIADRQDAHSFLWYQRNCGISRKTLTRARDAGELQVFKHQPHMTRTDWVWQFMTERDKAKLYPIHIEEKRKGYEKDHRNDLPSGVSRAS